MTELLQRFKPTAGVALCVAVALLSQSAMAWGWSPVVLALLTGLALGQVMSDSVRTTLAPGIDLAKRLVLRAGVVLFALHISFGSLAQGGLQIILVDAFVLASTFGLAMKLGPRLGLSGSQSALIGAGSSICGVSAILATATVVRARSEEVAVAVATITLCGLVAFAVHPLLWRLNGELQIVGGGAAGYGVYIGATVHDVAQVLATASAVVPSSMDAALLAKLGRVAMLAPFLLLLARWLAVGAEQPAVGAWRNAMLLPVLCVVAAVVGSTASHERLAWADPAAGLCLSTAVAGLGMATPLKALISVGRPALLLGGALLAWLLAGGALIQALVGAAR